jgi:hypothetical protein
MQTMVTPLREEANVLHFLLNAVKFYLSVNYLTRPDRLLNHATENGRMAAHLGNVGKIEFSMHVSCNRVVSVEYLSQDSEFLKAH